MVHCHLNSKTHYKLIDWEILFLSVNKHVTRLNDLNVVTKSNFVNIKNPLHSNNFYVVCMKSNKQPHYSHFCVQKFKYKVTNKEMSENSTLRKGGMPFRHVFQHFTEKILEIRKWKFRARFSKLDRPSNVVKEEKEEDNHTPCRLKKKKTYYETKGKSLWRWCASSKLTFL